MCTDREFHPMPAAPMLATRYLTTRQRPRIESISTIKHDPTFPFKTNIKLQNYICEVTLGHCRKKSKRVTPIRYMFSKMQISLGTDDQKGIQNSIFLSSILILSY